MRLPLKADTEVHNGHEVAAHQVIFRLGTLPPGTPAATVLAQLAQLGNADNLRNLSSALNIYLLHSQTNAVAALLNIVKNHPLVAYVEPDYVLKTSVVPNDPNFPSQWDMLNTTTPGADIGATLAWDISTGSTLNVIGVVDTGVDYTHPDLAANIWSAPASFTVNLSWGQLTCPAGSHGYNSITRSCDPKDDNNHGTHVSGTIGAIGNNAIGVAGVNWTTRIMGLKFLDSSGSGFSSDAIDAIEFGLQAKTIFGANANLRVLSNSWGGSGFTQSLLDEINKANTADVLFVAAAGNNGSNNDTTPFYPAAYNAPNLVAVAATTNTDTLASFSNYGKNTVHLGAPGVNILSTLPNDSYAFFSGTSMATPHVSGAAMLLLSKCALNTAALKTTLLANVDLLASLSTNTISGGRLNVNKAIRACSSAPFTPIRVHAGGGQYTDPANQVWSADTGFTGGSTFATGAAIQNTTTPALYQSVRYGNFQYQFAAPNGSYTVTLKFAEVYFPSAGSRVFNVAIDGTQVLTNFDIVAQAGGTLTALDQTFPVTVTNGQITIQFTSVVNNAVVNAIAIVQSGSIPVALQSVAVSPNPVVGGNNVNVTVSLTAPAPVAGVPVTLTGSNAAFPNANVTVGSGQTTQTFSLPTATVTQTTQVTITASYNGGSVTSPALTVNPVSAFTPIRVNAGGGQYTDPAAQVWSADTGFTGGSTFATGAAIQNTTTPVLYQSVRYGNFQYQFAAPNGSYTVTLKFAEVYFPSAGSRVFNVAIDGTQVLTNFDIVAQAGGTLKALDQTFPVTVTNGQITIQFTSVVNNAMVNSIAITSP